MTSKSRPAWLQDGSVVAVTFRAWKLFGFSVEPIGVALAEYCDKFVVGELQVTFGSIKEDFFIDTLRFLVGEAVAFVGDWIRHKCVKQFQSTDDKALALVACHDTAGIVRAFVVDFSRCHILIVYATASLGLTQWLLFVPLIKRSSHDNR